MYVWAKGKRQGIGGRDTGKLKASLIETEVMEYGLNPILDPGYVRTLLHALNRRLNSQSTLVESEIAGLGRRLSTINGSVRDLLDSVERDGSAAAQAGLRQTEQEKPRLEDQFQSLRARLRARGADGVQ